MSKGYVIVAIGDEYIEQAYLCALSIKNTQKEVNTVCLITTRQPGKEYAGVFDDIVVERIKDNGRYKTKLRSKVYDLTPYDETIVLDSDMIFTEDVSRWWENLSNKNLFFTTTIKTYRGHIADNTYYREIFKKHNLPNTYVALHYFKKSQIAGIFYSLVNYISDDESVTYKQILKTKKLIEPSFDFTCALAINMLDIEAEVTETGLGYPTFVHMKGRNQGWKTPKHNWLTKIPYYIDKDLNFYVGNYRQTEVFHYSEKDFATKEIIGKYKDYYDR